MVWRKPEDLNAGLPPSIEVFVSNSSWTPGVPLFSAYALIDLSDPDIGFKTVYGNSTEIDKTPLAYFQEEEHVPYIVVNGGYFNMTTRQSRGLIIHNSE